MSIAHFDTEDEVFNPIFPVTAKSVSTLAFQLSTGSDLDGKYMISDAQGNGTWQDGSGGDTVSSVTAGDATILIGGSPEDPTVSATGNFLGKEIKTTGTLSVGGASTLDDGGITTDGAGNLSTTGSINTVAPWVGEPNIGSSGFSQYNTSATITAQSILGGAVFMANTAPNPGILTFPTSGLSPAIPASWDFTGNRFQCLFANGGAGNLLLVNSPTIQSAYGPNITIPTGQSRNVLFKRGVGAGIWTAY